MFCITFKKEPLFELRKVMAVNLCLKAKRSWLWTFLWVQKGHGCESLFEFRKVMAVNLCLSSEMSWLWTFVCVQKGHGCEPLLEFRKVMAVNLCLSSERSWLWTFVWVQKGHSCEPLFEFRKVIAVNFYLSSERSWLWTFIWVQKGHGYHLDLLVLSGLVGICSLLGLPWFVAATVRSIAHVKSLVRVSETSMPGERPQMLGVRYEHIFNICTYCIEQTMQTLLSAYRLPLAGSWSAITSTWCR